MQAADGAAAVLVVSPAAVSGPAPVPALVLL